MVKTSHSFARGRARRLGVAAACASITLVGAGSAVGADVTKTGFAQGISGFPTLVGGGLGVFEADTPVLPADAVREVGVYDITVAATGPGEAAFAGAWRAYAVTDIRYHTDNTVLYPMDLQLAETAWAGEFGPEVAQKLTWLLRNADGLVAGEPDTQRAAAAIQIVVWQTLRNPQHNPPFLPRVDLVTPSVDPAVNDLAAKFTAVMDAGYTADPVPIAIAVTAASSGCTMTVTITGTPGAVVTLSAIGGTVPAAVVLDSQGHATIPVGDITGPVSVSATSSNDGVLVRADGVHADDGHLPNPLTHRTQAPEELIFLAGGTTATATGEAVCPTPPVGTPVGTPIAAKARFRIVKSGPRRAIAGQVITYRIKVTNIGAKAASAVSLRDLLPSGMSLFRRPTGATVKKGSVLWRISTLAPGASKTLSVRIRVDRKVSGRRCNRAVVSAVGVSSVKATACTTVRAVAGASRLPSVTG